MKKLHRAELSKLGEVRNGDFFDVDNSICLASERFDFFLGVVEGSDGGKRVNREERGGLLFISVLIRDDSIVRDCSITDKS